MCTVLLPPAVNPVAVNKYISYRISYHIISNVICYSQGRWVRIAQIGIATRYGLDGPGIEGRWGRDFPHQSRQGLGPTQPPVRRVPDLLPGGKAAEAWR